jgi:Holliday junction resolvase RusA-like endonuclease
LGPTDWSRITSLYNSFRKNLTVIAHKDNEQVRREKMLIGALKDLPKEPFDGPVRLTVTAYHSIADSWPKWKKALSKTGRIYPTKKPDADNIVEMLQEILKQKVYNDDAQIVDLLVFQRFGDPPRVELEVEQMAGFGHNVKRTDLDGDIFS